MTTSADESESTNEPTTRRKRLHRSTVVVAFLTLLIGVVVNCGGNVRHDEGFSQNASVNYGWPCEFAGWRIRYPESIPPAWHTLWRLERTSAFGSRPLMINIAVWIGLILIVVGFWEWRRRRRNSVFSFTLLDVFAATTILAAITYAFIRLYEDASGSRAHNSSYSVGRDTPRYIFETPADWFWQTLHIPETWRPTRRTHVSISFLDEQIAESIMHETGTARHLEGVYLDGLDFSPNAFDFSGWQNVRHLRIVDCGLSDEHVRMLPRLPSLQNLLIEESKATDSTLLLKLSHSRNLKQLRLYNASELHGHSLGELQSLNVLALGNVQIDDATLTQIGKLSQLRELELTDNDGLCTVTADGWNALKGLGNLETISIAFGAPLNSTFGDEAVAALSKLPRLRSVSIEKHSNLTDEGLAKLAGFPALSEFFLIENSKTHITEAGIASLEELIERRDFAQFFVTLPNMSKSTAKRLEALRRPPIAAGN